MAGSRKRKCKQSSGEEIHLIIRRLRCENCCKIHHELPDILVPYKRYTAESVEKIIAANKPADVSADEATLYRWRAWFKAWAPYALGCLRSIGLRFGLDVPVEDTPVSTQSAFQQIGRFVGEQVGWLARAVRPIVNINLWVHTRSAFLSQGP